MLKYGYSNLSLGILEYCDSNILISREQCYINHFRPEFNLLTTAGSRWGSSQSK